MTEWCCSSNDIESDSSLCDVCRVVHALLGNSPFRSDQPLQASQTTANAVCVIAQGIIKDATFQVIDSKTGRVYASTKDLSPNAQPGLHCRYTDWRYWNGVLSIAVLRIRSSSPATPHASAVRHAAASIHHLQRSVRQVPNALCQQKAYCNAVFAPNEATGMGRERGTIVRCRESAEKLLNGLPIAFDNKVKGSGHAVL